MQWADRRNAYPRGRELDRKRSCKGRQHARQGKWTSLQETNAATAVFRYEPVAGLCDLENDDDMGESTTTGLASVALRYEDRRREEHDAGERQKRCCSLPQRPCRRRLECDPEASRRQSVLWFALEEATQVEIELLFSAGTI